MVILFGTFGLDRHLNNKYIMRHSKKPHYDLNELQELINNADSRHITESSIDGAHDLGLSVTEIIDTVKSLTLADFHKTMPSEKVATAMQDVYKPHRYGKHIYLKLRKSSFGGTVVISFKEK